MIGPRRILMAGGTFACALGIGFIMQNTVSGPDAPASDHQAVRVASLQATPPPRKTASDVVAPQATGQSDASPVTDITLTSAAAPVPPKAAPQPVPLPASRVDGVQHPQATRHAGAAPDLPTEEDSPAFSCRIEMSATALAAAMAEIRLEAPCRANERFTLHHSGMMITEVTDEQGTSRVVVPALSAKAVFMASFPNGDAAMSSVTLDSLEYYDRAVIQWQGDSGLQLHAREYGADYGDEGHIWADRAGDLKQAVTGKGGVMTRLGAVDVPGAHIAEIYTFPTETAQKPGDVRLSVEAEITKANCGRDITAQSLEVRSGGTIRVRDLELAVPACDSVGDFLVLKNMLNDLKIAQR